jgi:hypothetical protein
MPKNLKLAMLIYIGFYYRNRDAIELNDKTAERIDKMIQMYRVRWW